MGRTSFTFPVPGRRQKHQSTIGPLVSTPMTKAQRILGAADLSIDAPRQWDESSASGISVSISERTGTSASTATTAYRRTPPLAQAQEDNGPRPTRNVNRWEVESETVPAYVHAGRPHADDTATSRDYMSDASSLRRRQSSSTLKSWYDKSKMPLSISQQTSSSAMAKGLPSKASALLDVDGTSGSPSDAASTISASTARAAKRPSRLNLAHLFSSSSSTGRHRDSAFVRHSPSSASLRSSLSSTAPTASPDTAYSTPPSPRTPRRLLRKPTRERLAEVAAAAAATSSPVHRPRSSSSNGAHGAKSTGTSTAVHCPRDLYDHYERAAFRNVLESPAEEEDDTDADLPDDDAAATRLLISDFPAAPVGPTALKSPPQQQQQQHHQLPPHPLHPRHSTASSSIATNNSNPIIREPLRRTTAASSTRSRQSTAETLPSLDHDYPSSLASVSSRHTKTSRHTTTSTGDSDRQGRSVLSLSSDSEGDSDVDDSYDASSRRSVPSIASQQQQQPPPMPHYRDTPSSPASRRSVCSRGADSDSASKRSGGKRTSLATTAGSTYLTVPGGGSPSSLKPTAFSPRSSSVNKIQPQTQPPQTPSYGFHEARAVNLRPVASTARSLSSVDVDVTVDDLDVNNAAPSSLRAGDQPTPPLSPSSVEFCLQPDMTFDAATHTAGTSSNPRLMAVTRQEQMLLAALRNKRAMMRETMLAEAEGDLQKQQQRQLRGHRHTSSQATIRGPEEKQQQQHRVLRHQGSATSTSSTVKSAPRLASPPHRHHQPPKQVAYVEPSPDLSDLMDFDDTMSASGSDDDRRRPFYSSSGSGSGGSSAGDMLAPPAGGMTRKKAVRLSAVGTAGPEVDCWGDDG